MNSALHREGSLCRGSLSFRERLNPLLHMNESPSTSPAPASGTPGVNSTHRSRPKIGYWIGHVVAIAAVGISLHLLASSRDQLANAQQRADNAHRAMEDAQRKTALAMADLEKLRDAKISSEAKLKEQAEAQGRRIAQLEKAEQEEQQQHIHEGELDSIVATLSQANRDLNRRLAAANRISLSRTWCGKAPHGKVIAAEPSWGFTILNIGERQGARPDTNYMVARGGSPIGKLKVTSVEPNQSIAEMLPATFARGTRVRPGDDVFYYPEEKSVALK